MKLHFKKMFAVVGLAAVMLFALGGYALAAPPWSDAPESYWTTNYGVTSADVATVADGYPDGTFKPTNPVTRGQFAKMSVSGLECPPSIRRRRASVDVPKGSTFYIHVEGAKAAGLINGTSATTFSPAANISRQQANSILGRYLSQVEIDTLGFIGSGALTLPEPGGLVPGLGGFLPPGVLRLDERGHDAPGHDRVPHLQGGRAGVQWEAQSHGDADPGAGGDSRPAGPRRGGGAGRSSSRPHRSRGGCDGRQSGDADRRHLLYRQ